MKKIRYILYPLIGVPVFLVLLWFIAVPDELLREGIEDAVKKSGGNMDLSIDGFKKGVFFTLYADNLNLLIDGRQALTITDFAGNYSPRYLTDSQLGFAVKGKIGTGDLNGILKLPLEGTVNIDRAELNAVPYLTQFNMDIGGSVSSDIHIINDVIKVIFHVPDLHIDDSDSVIPLLNTFKKLQGSLSIRGNTITVDSVSLEGDKGYARLKGSIKGNIMNLSLELMPAAGKLNTMEKMIIGKYIVSPGYYVVPIKGRVP